MKYLTLNEEALMLAIWKLKEDAYPVTIRDEFMKMTGKNVVYGALYNSLDYLLKKGMVDSRKGDPTPEKGGKRKVYFSLSKEGIEALHKTRELHASIWEGVQGLPSGVEEK
ncbi:PadR family transcriptional regulator [candidate division KSB1 bacterium]